MKPRAVLAAGVAIVATQLMAGCGDPADQDLCAQYADLVQAADDWQQQDPLTAEAGDLRAASEEFKTELDQFQAVAEGRLDTAISTLRAAIDGVRQAAIEADSEALEVARPLLEDLAEDIAEAWAVLDALADTQCDGT